MVGFLAGNVFDWGAKEVALLMEAGSLNFQAAVHHIGPRPWLIDHVDQWVERLRSGPPHKERQAARHLFIRFIADTSDGFTYLYLLLKHSLQWSPPPPPPFMQFLFNLSFTFPFFFIPPSPSFLTSYPVYVSFFLMYW